MLTLADGTEPKHELHHQRLEYEISPPSEDGMSEEPFTQFESWYQASFAAQVLEPNAMVLPSFWGGLRYRPGY